MVAWRAAPREAINVVDVADRARLEQLAIYDLRVGGETRQGFKSSRPSCNRPSCPAQRGPTGQGQATAEAVQRFASNRATEKSHRVPRTDGHPPRSAGPAGARSTGTSRVAYSRHVEAQARFRHVGKTTSRRHEKHLL